VLWRWLSCTRITWPCTMVSVCRQDQLPSLGASMATPALAVVFLDWARTTCRRDVSTGCASSVWVSVNTRRSRLSTDMMSSAVVTLFTGGRPGLAIILPLEFQVPTLKVLSLRCMVPVPMLEALSAAAASSGGLPRPPVGAAGLRRLCRVRWLAVGSSGAPGDAGGRGILRRWLPLAPTAPTPAGGGPAVTPPSPSGLLRLSEVPTACAGREPASLY